MVKAKTHIAIIVVLAVAFFALLILSTTNSKINAQYNFVDMIEINNYADLDYIKIGDLVIENNGLLSSRVDLKDYIICQISDIHGSRYYEVQYRGERTIQGKVDLFSYNYYQKRLDISAGEKLELDISVTPYSLSRYTIEDLSLYNATLPFYLYELSDDEDRWNFCDSAKTDEALKVINVKFNIEPSKTTMDTIATRKY